LKTLEQLMASEEIKEKIKKAITIK
jgi:hypothetical protein